MNCQLDLAKVLYFPPSFAIIFFVGLFFFSFIQAISCLPIKLVPQVFERVCVVNI